MKNIFKLGFMSLMLLLAGVFASAQSPIFWFPNSSDNLQPVDDSWGLQITPLINCDTIDTDASGVFSCGTDQTGAGGSAIIFDIGDDGGNDSTDLTEIATSGDTNAIFTEPSADKMLIDLSKDWPKADTATALAGNGANCGAGQSPLGVDASGAVESCFDVWTEAENTAASYISGNETITLSGDVSGSGATAITTTIGASQVEESMLNALDVAGDEECLTWETASSQFEWQACGGGGDIFKTINTPAGTNPVADSSTDTLNITQGTGLTITGNETTDNINFNLHSYLIDIVDGTFATNFVNTAHPWADNEVSDTLTSSVCTGNAATCTIASAGDAAVDFFGAGVDAVTDTTTCTDLEGTNLSIAGGTLNATDTNTNAGTICANGEFLNGDTTCDAGYLDADGVDDDLPDANEVVETMLKAVNEPTDEYVLTYESTTGDFEWEVDQTGVGGSGSMTTVKENGVQLGGSDIVTLDFLGADFNLTETPDTEVNITINDGGIDHDSLANFVSNEHLDWTSDLGAVNIHTGNYPITDSEVPNDITIDLATLASTVTNATFTTALTVDTGTVGLTGNIANNSVLTLGAGASSVSGANTGDQDLSGYWDADGDIAADEISESKIAFSTACGAGNHYYLNGNDLACEANTTDTNLTQEEVDDFVNLLLKDADSVNTRITLTYDDVNNAFDFVVDDMNDDVPDAGDFGNAVDLDANGALNTGSVADNEIDYANVTLADFDYQTAWRLFYSNTAGDVTELALGADNTYLMSNGAAAAPTFESIAAGGDVTDVFDCSTGDCNTLTVGTSEWLVYGTGFIDANRFAGVTTVDGTEFGYLNGVTSAIQTQFSGKQGTLTNSAGLRGALSDESGAGVAIFAGGAIGAGTATTPGANDNDTSIATTAYTQGEINGAGGTGLTCAAGVCNVDLGISITTGEITDDTITHADIADSDQADTKCIWFEDPVAADDFKSIWANKTANNFLFTEIWGESDQTVSFDLQVDDGTPADVSGTDIAPAAGEAEDTTLAGDTTLAAGEELDLIITSVSGTPTWVSICFTGNWVD